MFRHHPFVRRLPVIDILGITILILLVVITNPPGTNQWLIGWDNINPEFNILLNLKRALFSVWQEYQGLGLLAGMGHAADIPRLLVLALFSFFVPINYLRFGWVILMLLMGTFGAYALLRAIIPRIFPHIHDTNLRMASIAGSVYLFVNFATRQTFYTPFEPFVTHFGFLPWLILTIIFVLEHPSKFRVFWFLVLSLLAVPQAYVQTIFISYLLGITIISLNAFIHTRTLATVKRIAFVFVATFFINAFWLLPTIYFGSTSSQVTVNAKINQMATEESYLKNQAFGTLTNTIQLKGFWFDTFDFDPQRTELTPILGYWRTFSDTPWVSAVVYGLFGIVLFGAWTLLYKRTQYWLLGLWIAGITLLTIQTPPFSWVNDTLNTIPLFHQAFRLRFTKFSSLSAISYTVLFGIGVAAISGWLTRLPKWMRKTVVLVVFGACISLSFPVWQGHMFYQGIKLSIPQEYTQLFSYFADNPDKGRIMNLPQHMYWGWTYYKFGYIGWGFPWYGIEQPIVDRAFDVWSATGENYFWELSRALYSKDSPAIQRVIQKYDIHYILLDENISTPNNFRTLFTDETKELVARIPGVTKVAVFGRISVYKISGQSDTSFVSVARDLPTVNAYDWTDNDVAYGQLGDYIESSQPSITFPFRSLFTKRTVPEREFTVHEYSSSIEIGSIHAATSASVLKDHTIVYDSSKSTDLTSGNVKNCGLLSVGTATAISSGGVLQFQSTNGRGCLSYNLPTLAHKFGYLVAVETRHIAGRPLMISFINDTARHVELETYLPDNKQMTTHYFVLPPLAADGLGYTVYISNDSIGNYPSVNDIARLRIFQIPYNEITTQKMESQIQKRAIPIREFTVDHPNPAWYSIKPTSTYPPQTTLMLSQTFDPGWIAWSGGKLLPHVHVNNWQNGWALNPGTNDTIYIFFWPQLLEFIGFALLPLPFLFAKKLAS